MTPENLDVPMLPDYGTELTGQPVVNPQKMAKQIMKLAMQKMKTRKPLLSHRRRVGKTKWY